MIETIEDVEKYIEDVQSFSEELIPTDKEIAALRKIMRACCKFIWKDECGGWDKTRFSIIYNDNLILCFKLVNAIQKWDNYSSIYMGHISCNNVYNFSITFNKNDLILTHQTKN